MCTIMEPMESAWKNLKTCFWELMRGPKPTATVHNVYPGSDPEQGYSSTLNTSWNSQASSLTTDKLACNKQLFCQITKQDNNHTV